MKLGTLIPQNDVGGTRSVLKEFAQTAEGLGYHFLEAADHVLGVNVANRPGWGNRNTSADFFHDPCVMFGYLSGVTDLEFSTGVLILAQRQAVLVAKQAASLDVLCDGKFRLGVGVGWNPIEFVGLNEDFSNRGRRSAEQVEVMQALWAEPHVTFKGRWHTIDDAGINPLPTRRRVPVWFGGHHEQTLKRIVRYGDGWMMLAYPPGAEAVASFDRLRRIAEHEGRDPATIGLEVWVSTAEGGPADWRREFEFWKQAGVTHVTVASTHGRGPHVRIAGRTMADHIRAITDYHKAVADLL